MTTRTLKNGVNASGLGAAPHLQDEKSTPEGDILPLSALLLCADAQILSTLAKQLDELNIDKYQYGSSASALKAAAQNTFELFILDLDLLGAHQLLQLASLGHSIVIIAISREAEILKAVVPKGVHFAWRKPVAPDLISRDIKAACGMAKIGRRPDYRIPVQIQAAVSVYRQGATCALGFGTVTNLNASGLCLRLNAKLPKGATVVLAFHLPDSRSTIHVTGKVIWGDGGVQNGVHFSFVPAVEGQQLRRWVAERTPSEVDLVQQMIASQSGSELRT